MKLVIIFSLLVIFLALLYFRLRPYIKLARQVFGVMRGARSMGRSESAQQPLRPEAATTASKLVRCDACGTWIPATRAVQLRSSRSTYCSHACLEASTNTGSRRRTAG